MNRAALTIRLVLPAAAGVVLSMLAGCGDVNTVMREKFGMEVRKNEQGILQLYAVDRAARLRQSVASENPDERREGVVWLGERDRCNLDSVVKLLAHVVRNDPDPTVRSAAARSLGNSVHPGAIEPLVDALDDDNRFVRMDATVALTDKSGDNVKRALLVRLSRDEEPQVRAAAARALSNYHETRVLESLIGSLRDRDFAVVYEAEQALIRMTGQTFNYDPEAWNRWLAGLGAGGDPFARAGETPPSMQGNSPSVAQRMRDSLRDAWFWWQADEKQPD